MPRRLAGPEAAGQAAARAVGRGPVRGTNARAGGRRDLGSTGSYVLLVGLALAVCALLKAPTLYYPGDETDEKIYWQLAENLAQGRPYSLQGTALLTDLSPGIYDHPLFHHPPLFPALLVPFVLLGARHAAVVVPWFGHLFAVLAVALVARHALRGRPAAPTNLAAAAYLLPVVGVCADPLLVFVSRKLWIDSLLAGLVALSMAAFLIADGRRRVSLAASGTLLGLAALAKLSALLVLPIYIVAIVVRRDGDWRARVGSMGAIALPVGLLVVPWCVLFYLRCGVFVPPWVKPDAWLIEHYPFVKALVSRPWYYYAVKLPLVMPLVGVAAWTLLRDGAAWRDRGVQVSAAWFVVLAGAITLMGVDGYGFQMRHLAPAVTAVYVLLALLIARGDRPVLVVASVWAILVGTVTGAMYLLLPRLDEILSLAEVARVIRF